MGRRRMKVMGLVMNHSITIKLMQFNVLHRSSTAKAERERMPMQAHDLFRSELVDRIKGRSK